MPSVDFGRSRKPDNYPDPFVLFATTERIFAFQRLEHFQVGESYKFECDGGGLAALSRMREVNPSLMVADVPVTGLDGLAILPNAQTKRTY